MHRIFSRAAILTGILANGLLLYRALADEPPEPPVEPPVEPTIAAASEEPRRVMQGFQVPAGLQVSLFAAEPLVANPVSFFVDRHGRVFVCESFRQNAGVTDNRGHDQAWLDDDLAAQSVEDRLAYHKKHLKEKLADYTRHDDRIRLLVDSDGDHKADRSTVFANHFHRVVDGTGASVLEYRGRVYFTCIPDLWSLRDADGDGVADVRESMHSGFGVRVAFRGHDLHGLTIGPDGRLYFSVGDRGYSVATSTGRLHDPESGAVFRCELDGSHLEVVATGLRNPQELAFDDFGNLFTGDNNSDSGDKARWVYIIEGSDSGWRMAYQYLPDRGPFNRERIWHPFHADQPAYIVPPIINFADGPSGLAYDPGTGLPEHFRGRFFLCDFRGGPSNSGIRTFRVKRQGAFFELVDAEQSFWRILATDVQFGPDGALYVSDWVNGWNGEGKGRIYRFFAPDEQQSAVVQEVASLLGGDWSQVATPRLVELLGHADRRIRQEAQFALVDRNESATLLNVAQKPGAIFARLHAVWGLGQLGRRDPGAKAAIALGVRLLLSDTESEVRAQSAKLLGDFLNAESVDGLIERLSDPDLRVRAFAALSLGKLCDAKAIPALHAMLADNADRDPVMRHAGIMALAGVNNVRELASAAHHPSRSVRLASVVALRRLKNPLVSIFLQDGDEQVVVEAARAIHDVPIPSAMPALAALASTRRTDDALWRRILNANFRQGGGSHAESLAAVAARSDVPEPVRLEALDMLAEWEQPSSRDRVLGMWRPMEGVRSTDAAANALRRQLGFLLTGSLRVRARAAQAASKLGIPEAGAALKELFADRNQKDDVRADAVLGLAELKAPEANDAVVQAVADASPVIRAAGRLALVRLHPAEGVVELQRAITAAERVERQSALATLAGLSGDDASAAVKLAMDKLLAGEVPPDTHLDVLEAASRQKSPAIAERVAEYERGRSKDDPLAAFRELLVGGDAAKGERVFYDRVEVSCVRCHKIKDRGGEVGPDLTQIAVDKSREYLLEAIVLPNRAIAKGYESIVIVDADGRIHVGVLKNENEQDVRIITAEGLTETIAKSEIDERSPAKSPMPEDLPAKISKRELRDLVEFLSQLKPAAN